MSINYFDQQQTIAKHLIEFIRYKGFSKMSLSKLTGISRPTIDQILKANSPNQTTYNSQISKINETFNLPEDYFLTTKIQINVPATSVYAYSDNRDNQERSAVAQDLLDGLDNVLDIYSLYLK